MKLLVQLEHSEESFGRNLYGSELTHFLLTFMPAAKAVRIRARKIETHAAQRRLAERSQEGKKITRPA